MVNTKQTPRFLGGGGFWLCFGLGVGWDILLGICFDPYFCVLFFERERQNIKLGEREGELDLGEINFTFNCTKSVYVFLSFPNIDFMWISRFLASYI